MNKRERELVELLYGQEQDVLKDLEKQYRKTLDEINTKIRILQSDELTSSKVYQLQYQEALKKQISAIIENLHSNEYSTIQQFLSNSYTTGFVGTMYNIAGQGIPMILPIDQNAAVKAILTDSKLNESLYDALGVDANNLKKTIRQEITRGIAGGMSYNDIARNITNATRTPLSNSKRIAVTEGHRIQQAATYDAQKASKAKGADVVKQWDSTLDGKTRPTHRKLDGQIREVEKPFEEDGKEAMFPGDFGDPAEDCNCRCVSLTRARWALDEDELKTLEERASFFGLISDDSKAFGKEKAANFKTFKENYLKANEILEKTGTYGKKTIDFSQEYSKIKLGNDVVREWYVKAVSKIVNRVPASLPLENRAIKAFNARNNLRIKARSMMLDEKTRKMLDEKRPNKTFEELVASKIERKGMTREEAIEDILKTATTTNKDVNREFGILE